MRILLIVPNQSEASGNLVTARRYRQGLRARGHAAELLAVEPGDRAPLAQALASFRPDLVHLLHAFRAGQPWLDGNGSSEAPWVVSLTGTDLSRDLHSPHAGPLVRQVMAGAAAILTQNPLTAADLPSQLPGLAEKMRFLPPGIVLGTAPWPLRSQEGISPETLIFLHPAGIRPVKGNLELLLLFKHLAGQGDFVLCFCGPLLDAEYGKAFLAEIERCPWARYLGIIPPEAVPAAMAEADVVLNHSFSEGLPNALLEAASLGRPMLVRDIPGNAAVVEDGRNGLLYRDDREFLQKAEALLRDEGLRRRLAVPRPERYRPEGETQALEAIYREILEGK